MWCTCASHYNNITNDDDDDLQPMYTEKRERDEMIFFV